MELLITLGVVGGIFALALLILGLTEVAVYIVAGMKAFPVKVQNIYEELVKNNREFIAKKEARKIAKQEAKLKAKKEKLEKKQNEVLANVAEEVKVAEANIESNQVVTANVSIPVNEAKVENIQ